MELLISIFGHLLARGSEHENLYGSSGCAFSEAFQRKIELMVGSAELRARCADQRFGGHMDCDLITSSDYLAMGRVHEPWMVPVSGSGPLCRLLSHTMS